MCASYCKVGCRLLSRLLLRLWLAYLAGNVICYFLGSISHTLRYSEFWTPLPVVRRDRSGPCASCENVFGAIRKLLNLRVRFWFPLAVIP